MCLELEKHSNSNGGGGSLTYYHVFSAPIDYRHIMLNIYSVAQNVHLNIEFQKPYQSNSHFYLFQWQLILFVCCVHSVRLAGPRQVSTGEEVFAGSNAVVKVKTLLHKLVNKLKTPSSDYPKTVASTQHNGAADNPHVAHFCVEWAADKA